MLKLKDWEMPTEDNGDEACLLFPTVCWSISFIKTKYKRGEKIANFMKRISEVKLDSFQKFNSLHYHMLIT